MATVSEDISKDVIRFSAKAVATFMKTSEFQEGIHDAVAKSVSKRMLMPDKYVIKDKKDGDTFIDGVFLEGINSEASVGGLVGTNVGSETIVATGF